MGTLKLCWVDISLYASISFSWDHKRRDMCVHVCQVLNGISNDTQGMFYACVCICLCLSLLVCTLHPRAVMSPFFIRTIIVGLSSGSTSCSLTLVKICQVNFLCISCDNWVLTTSRQQTLKILQEMYSI